MQQRTSPLHVAMIMDGNGRWATRRRMPRVAGHRAGAAAVRTIVETACAEGVPALTLYAFSADNWRRPAGEVGTLMAIFTRYLRAETPRLIANGIRLSIIGRRDRLPAPLRSAIETVEQATAPGSALHLRLAIDYSARAAIEAGEHLPDVDLLIRTGGEQRLSDFLLWECAYAEFYFTETMWPDFGPSEFRAALRAFQSRDRRYGALPARAS